MTLRAYGIAVRTVAPADSVELAGLLNAIISRGGTTAFEQHFTPDALEQAYLIGDDVHCCVVAVDGATGQIEGFQTLGRYPADPSSIGDIGTFVRIDGAQRGVGSLLFAATCARAHALGLVAIHAVIRADNSGGLAFYRKAGFIDHEVIRGVPLRDGTPIDRIVKRYALVSFSS